MISCNLVTEYRLNVQHTPLLCCSTVLVLFSTYYLHLLTYSYTYTVHVPYSDQYNMNLLVNNTVLKVSACRVRDGILDK